MAQNIVIQHTDDLDGTPADETVRFALDGINYEIDLSARNAQALRNDLGDWIKPARRTGGKRSRAEKVSTQQIRAWAKDNGYTIGDRGRIHKEIVDAWKNK